MSPRSALRRGETMAMRIIIIGGSFGGLTAAYELRKHLDPGQCEILLISKERRFIFIPSLPWVALGSRSLDRISFDLAGPLERLGIRFVHASVERVDPAERKGDAGGGRHPPAPLVTGAGP